MTTDQKPTSQPKATSDNAALLQHLERARRIVQEEWPAWKREILSQTTRSGEEEPVAT